MKFLALGSGVQRVLLGLVSHLLSSRHLWLWVTRDLVREFFFTVHIDVNWLAALFSALFSRVFDKNVDFLLFSWIIVTWAFYTR